MSKLINLFFLLMISSCAVTQNAPSKRDFVKEKNNIWQYNSIGNYYPCLILKPSKDSVFYLWTKYKDFLVDKDTNYVKKEFGIPNYKSPQNNFYIYNYFPNSDYLMCTKKNPPHQIYNCNFFKFIFEDNKLKNILFISTRTLTPID